jgi:hypothetical protein
MGTTTIIIIMTAIHTTPNPDQGAGSLVMVAL